MAARGSPGRVLVNRALGIFVFLLIIALMNVIAWFFTEPMYLGIVRFINSNLWILITTSLLLGLGDVFKAFAFPLNLPAPLFHAVGAVLVVYFIAQVLALTGITGALIAGLILVGVLALVFFVVLIIGYILIFIDLGRGDGPSGRKQQHSRR